MRQQGCDPRLRGLGLLSQFPDELVAYLMHRLEVPELLALSQTSKLMRVLCCEEPIWLQKHLDRHSQSFSYRGSWRATFLAYHPACGRADLQAADLVPIAAVPGYTSEILYRRWYRCHVDLSGFVPATCPPPASGSLPPLEASGGGSIPLLDAAAMTAAEFEERFDQPGQPVMLSGLTASWPGAGNMQAWQPDTLAEAFGDRLFKATKPFLTGGRIKMRLADYLAYSQQQHDEEPLYIFDPAFGETAPELLQQYSVPHIFAHDLFACLGHQREDFRWLVMGPARSGASWHVDPSATSAWNTLLAGRKRWALYPPHKVPPGVEVGIDSDGSPAFESPTSLQWFLDVYPHLSAEHRPLEVVQHPGETIFLPAGWWHAVLNLDTAVAVTQNFVSPANLPAAVRWLALGAGSHFDPHLVPAYLSRQQQQQQERCQQERCQQNGQPQQQFEGGGDISASKRRYEPCDTRQQKKRQRATNGSLFGERLQDSEAAGQSRDDQSAEDGSGFERHGGQDEEEEEEEGQHREEALAAAQAAAAQHLDELDLGFAKDCSLSPWLRLLLQRQEPSASGQPLRPSNAEVWQLAQQWTDTPAWQPRLVAACRAAGLPEPQHPWEYLPLATGPCVVFEVGSTILKFFPPSVAHATAMGCMEVCAYLNLAQSGSAGSGCCARLLHAGLLDLSTGSVSGRSDCVAAASGTDAALAAAEAPTPYLVLSKAPGASFGSCMGTLTEQQWLAAAAATGRSLAAVHTMPLPAAVHATPGSADATATATARSGGGAAGPGSSTTHSEALCCCTAWVARDGVVFTSSVGTIDLRQETAAAGGGVDKPQSGSERERKQGLVGRQQLVLRHMFPQVASKLLGSSMPAAAAAAAVAVAGGASPAATVAPTCPRCQAWLPFVEFLRRQRQQASTRHSREETLPPQLLQQVDAYLPQDPAQLVGCGCLLTAAAGVGAAVGSSQAAAAAAPAACIGPMPAWLQGDLTPGNLLLTAPALQQPVQWHEGRDEAEPQENGGNLPVLAASPDSCSASMVVIDFADGGQGDPLWDLVVLLLRTFRCKREAGQAFMQAYSAALPLPPNGPNKTAEAALAPLSLRWPRRPPAVRLSCVAMCYTLLHELGPMAEVFKRLPQLWQAASLEEVEQAVWGWLDAAVAG